MNDIKRIKDKYKKKEEELKRIHYVKYNSKKSDRGIKTKEFKIDSFEVENKESVKEKPILNEILKGLGILNTIKNIFTNLQNLKKL